MVLCRILNSYSHDYEDNCFLGCDTAQTDIYIYFSEEFAASIFREEEQTIRENEVSVILGRIVDWN
jgi:hypothetical protein